MLRFSANLSLLFKEVEWISRFKAARDSGFSAVEIQFPYHLSPSQLLQQLQEHELHLALFNVDAATLLQGGEGLAAVPKKKHQFKRALEQSLVYADILKPTSINVLPGRCLDNARTTEYLDTFKNNLLYACNAFRELGIQTVFEAVNTHDMPGFLIHSGAQMLDIMTELNQPNLLMQYDIYHMHKMAENCATFLTRHINKIGHIQFADCPGRHEPGKGQVDFAELFGIIADSDYPGWAGAEYIPSGVTAESLDWLSAYPHCRI